MTRNILIFIGLLVVAAGVYVFFISGREFPDYKALLEAFLNIIANVWDALKPLLIPLIAILVGVVGLIATYFKRIWCLHGLHRALRRHARQFKALIHLHGFRDRFLRFLKLDLEVEPLLKCVADLQNNEIRGKCITNLAKLSDAWTSLINTCNGIEMQRILTNLQEVYADEEHGGLSGNKGRRFIITNFVAYSRFVKALVNETRKQYPERKIECFTTLAMPLPKWFNFAENPSRIALPWSETVQHWEEYTKTQAEFTEYPNYNLNVQRCVLSLDNSCIRENYEYTNASALRYEYEMLKYAKYSVLCKENGHRYGPAKAHLFDRDSLNDLLEGARDTLCENVKTMYTNSSLAYMIYPNDGTASLPDIRKYVWKQIGEVFQYTFHSNPRDTNCRYYSFKDTDVTEWFFHTRENMRLPLDFFLVGSKNGHATEWLSCLAADLGADFNRVTLEFVSQSLDPDRFGLITTYVQWLQSKSSPLADKLT